MHPRNRTPYRAAGAPPVLMRDRAETGTPAARDILTALECGRAGCPCHLSARRGHGLTHCPVPGHGRGQGDRGPSLRVTDGRDKPLFKCFTGCESTAVVAALQDRGIYPRPRPAGDGRQADTSCRGVTLQALAAAKGLPLEFLRDLGCRDVEHRGAPAVAIPYRDRSGVPMFERRRLSLTAQGRRFWQPSGMAVAPYGLDRLGEARRLGRILLVEGESDCWALWRHQEAALGLPGKGTWRPEWARHLEGIAAVYVWQEPDAADLTERVARDLPAVRVIAAPEGIKDVAEAHVRGLDLRSWLADLQAGATAPAVPGAPAHEQVTLGAIPSYPLTILPAPLRELVEANPGLPRALIAGAGMAALASAIGPRVQIELASGWRRRSILWVANIASRGAGKSPAQAAAFKPLREHDAAVLPEYRAALSEWRKSKRRGPRPPDPTLLGNDLTLEALARRLDRADGAAALDVDELAMFLRGLGEYKRGGGGDRGRILALWTGDPWRNERVTEEIDIYVVRPVVVICGGLQPALHELLGPESDGLRPRWLPHLAAMPDASLGPPAVDTPPSESWAELLRRLIERRDQGRVLKLEAPARARFHQHQRRWKTAGAGDEGESVSAALVKADQQALAMLLVLAEAEDQLSIGEDLVDRAATAIDFCLDCWRALPEQGGLTLSRKDEVLDQGVERLRSYLEEHGGQATRRDLLRTAAAGARTAADLTELLRRYEAVYPGTVSEEANPGRGPRPIVVRAPRRDAARQRTGLILLPSPDPAIVSADNYGAVGEGGNLGPSELGETAREGHVSTARGADNSAADNSGADNTDGSGRLPNDADGEWEIRL